MIYRSFIGIAAFFLLAASVVKAQNSFTITAYSSDSCFSSKGSVTAVSGVCTAANIDGLGGYVKAYMVPNSTTTYQYLLYSDAACTDLFTASTGTCSTCTGDKRMVSCPSVYVAPPSTPAWPNAAAGFIQLTECYNAACSGNTCAVTAIKSGTCVSQTNPEMPAVQTIAASCSASTGFRVGFFTDSTCSTVGGTNTETVLTCASKSARSSSYRKYDCATANDGSVSVSPARGIVLKNYNTTGSTCSGSPISETTIANGLCTASDAGTYQTLSCSGGSGTVSVFSDNKCTNKLGSTTSTFTGSCSSGEVISCSGASSLVASAASMLVMAAAMAVQRLF